MSEHLLSLMTFFPLLGMFIILMLPKNNGGLLKGATLVFTLITFVISLPLALDPVLKLREACTILSSLNGSVSRTIFR